jgi:hypothetical protein
MTTLMTTLSRLSLAFAIALASALSGCGGAGGAGADGARVSATAQSITFGAAPALPLHGSATVAATASSGLAVVFRSATPDVCTVVADSGLVTAIAPGTCVVAANQSGNSHWAQAPEVTQSIAVVFDPNQTISFGVPPALTLHSSATVSATATSGLPVAYSSLTPAVCTVDANTGVVIDLTAGDCIIAADQGGGAYYNAAPQVSVTINVPLPAVVATVPGAPSGVAATLGSNASTVVVSVGSVDSGGSAISGYTVVSSPAGITATAASAPVTVDCGGSCAGHSFAIYATNAIGDGAASTATDVLTRFDVITTWYEPDTQPNNSIFIGSFTLNSTTGAVSGLAGSLSESMTGSSVGYPNDTMTWVPLSYQLQTWRDSALGGIFVATFSKSTTPTFLGNTWTPTDGVDNGGVFAGGPAIRNYSTSIQNSYALIFVPDDPLAALTQAQINTLAYADCAPGGMMGSTCMTGTSLAYGAIGTMSGYPLSQTITRH